MATITSFGGGRLTGTYSGLYHTVAGIGITLGNLLSGAALGTTGQPTTAPSALPWLLLGGIGAAGAPSLYALDRTGRLEPASAPPEATSAPPSPAAREQAAGQR